MCGGLKTSLFLTYCKQLLPKDKTSWSFLQEISKCLCLEHQVSGTHSKARKCLENRRVQGFSFKEISRSPGLHHRGDRNGCRGQLPAWFIFSSDLWETNSLSCSDSFCQSIKFVKPWFLGFFMYEVGIIIEPALRGSFQDSIESSWKQLARCQSYSKGFDSFSSPRILTEHLLHTLCASSNETKIPATRTFTYEGGCQRPPALKILLLSLLGSKPNK